MATTLYPTEGNTTFSAYLPTPYQRLQLLPLNNAPPVLRNSRGAEARATAAATVAGSGQIVTVNEFMTAPLTAGVTISGSITLNTRCMESSMSANIGPRVEILKMSGATGLLTSILDSPYGSEMSSSAETAYNWSATPTSTDFAKGDRIVVRLEFSSVGTQNSGYTGTFWVNGPTAGASGDTYVTFTETLSFETWGIFSPDTVLYLRDITSGITGSDTCLEMNTSQGATTKTDISRTVGAGAIATADDTNARLQLSGNNVRWYSPPIAATTLPGPSARVWLYLTSNVASNLGGYSAVLFKRTVAGVETDIARAAHLDGNSDKSIQTTLNQNYLVVLGFDDVSLADGDRLGLKIYADDSAFGTHIDSDTLTLTYAGTGTWHYSYLDLHAALTFMGLSSFTVDAVLVKTFTADAVIAAPSFTGSGTFTENSIIRVVVGGSFVAAAILRTGRSGLFSADAVKASIFSFSAQATIRATVSQPITADAWLSVLVWMLSADASIRRVTNASLTASATSLSSAGGSVSASALIRVVQSKAIPANAYIAFLLRADASIRSSVASSFSGGAWIYVPRTTPPQPGQTKLIEIFVDDVEITDDVMFSDATFTQSVNGAPGSFSVRVNDPFHMRSFTSGSEIRLDIDGKTRFGGYIMSVHRGLVFPYEDTTNVLDVDRYWLLEGVDYNILFTKRILYDKVTNTNILFREWPAGTRDDVIIKYMFDTYTDLPSDGATYLGVDHVGSPNPDKNATVGMAGVTFGDVMTEINRLISAVWYFDQTKDLKFVDVDLADAFKDLSDNPSSGQVGYRDLTITNSGSSLANDALVWGTGRGNDHMAFGRVTNTTSIATHGLWQYGEFTSQLYKQASVDERANTIVNGTAQSLRGRKNDKVAWTLTTFDYSFMVGQKVNVESEVYGLSDVIPIRRMTITFPTPTDIQFQLVLSHEIDEPWNLYEWYFPKFDIRSKIDIPKITVISDPPPPVPCPGGVCDCGITDTFTRTVADGWGNIESGNQLPYSINLVYDASASVQSGVGILHHDGDSTNLANDPSDWTASASMWATGGGGYPNAVVESLIGSYTASIRFKFDIVPDGYNDDVRGFTNLFFRVGFETGFATASYFDWTTVYSYVQVSSDAAYGCIGIEDRNTYFPFPNKTVKTDWTAGVWYRMKFEKALDPVRVKFKVWKESDSEPGWDFDLLTTTPGLDPAAPDPYDYLAIVVGDNRRSWDTRPPEYGGPGSGPVPLNVEFDDLDISGADRCGVVQFDNFDRIVASGSGASASWGTSNSGFVWTQFGRNGTVQADVSSGTGSIYLATGAWTNLSFVTVGGPWCNNAWTMTALLRPTHEGNCGISVHSPNDVDVIGFEFEVENDIVRGSDMTDVAFALDPFTMYYVKWEVDLSGGVDRFRVWKQGEAEPVTWLYTSSAPTLAASSSNKLIVGAARVLAGSSGTVGLWDFIDFDYTGRPCYYAEICTMFDDFSRTVTGGWGTATPSGVAWSGTTGLSVNGSQGLLDASASSTVHAQFAETGISVSYTALIYLSFSSVTGDGYRNVFFKDTTNGIDIEVAPIGDGFFEPVPSHIGVYFTNLSGNFTSVSMSAGTVYALKYSIDFSTGTLNVKFWDASAAEPASWLVTEVAGGYTPGAMVYNVEMNDVSSTPAITYVNSIEFCVQTAVDGGVDPDCVEPPVAGPSVANATGTGSQTVFHLPVRFVAGSTRVWIDGYFMRPGASYDYTEQPDAGTITFEGFTPEVGSIIHIEYEANGSL